MDLRNSYHLYAIITVITWSLPNVFTRLASAYFTAPSLAFLRFLFASVILLVVVLVARIRPPKLHDLPWFILSALVGFTVYMVVFSYGQSMVGSATGSLIIATSPVVTALMALALFKERLAAHQWVATGIEFVGVIVLTVFEGVLTFNSGVFWLLLAVVLISAYNIIQRKLTRNYTGMQASIYSILLGTVFLFVSAPGGFTEIAVAPPEAIGDLLVLAIGPTAIGYVTWSIAMSKGGKTAQVSNYMFVTPFLAALAGFIFAGEVPTWSTLLGGVIILLGVALFTFGGNDGGRFGGKLGGNVRGRPGGKRAKPTRPAHPMR